MEKRDDSQSVTSQPASSSGQSWADVKAIFEGALTLESSEWSAFLDLRCGSNDNLRREVESLLDAHSTDSEFLEEPLQILNGIVEVDPPKTPDGVEPGMRIGAYQLVREIGKGGMGAVYRANRADQEFEQEVAIKVIRIEKHSELAVRRFRHERQILAKLDHPYIARLLDGGTTPSGMPYFVMEFVEGETLTHYCDARNLSTRERVELFVKACSAVQYAHERNIIHRDIKPGNILVTANGAPKLLDFGIAKILEAEGPAPDATAAGLRMLTPAYASPEQMHGEAATVRSDVYSLGVVLYELLCGERPSLRTVQNSSSGHEDKEGHLSPRLRAVVFNAIRLAPEERYGGVAALTEDLHRYLDGSPPVISASESREKISIGILPFRELGAELATADPFLRSALVDSLITRLSKVERLSVRPTSAVLKYAHRSDAVRAGRELRVQYILEGTLHMAGDRIRLNAQLVSTETGIAVWASRFEEGAQDLLSLEDSIAEQIAYAVIPQLTGEEEFQLKRGGTVNGHAHDAYLRGRFHWSRSAGESEELAKALVYFMEAVAEDPNYAAAHAGVADYYLRLGLWGGLPPKDSFAAAIDEARTALRLDPSLAEAHATLGFCLWAFERDYVGAEREFQLAIAHNPEYASAHHWFGLLNSARNAPELALVNLERAHKIDSNSPVIAAALGFVHYNARRYPESLELLLQAVRDLGKSAVLREMLTWTYLQLGDVQKAFESARRAIDLGGRTPSALAALAKAEAAAGNSAGATALCRELNELRSKRYVSGYDLASVYLAAGDAESALNELQRAYDNKDWWLCWIAVDPRWDPLREEPRFQQLISLVRPGELVRPPKLPRRKHTTVTLAVVLAAALILMAVVSIGTLRNRKHSLLFSNPHFSKLTGDGTAGQAVISQDGKTVVYTTRQSGNSHIWLRDLQSHVRRHLLSLPGETASLALSADGRTMMFQSFPALRPFDRTLYRFSVSGGQPTALMTSMSGPAAMSPDSERLALIRANNDLNRDELLISDLKGNQRILLTTVYPERLSWDAPPAWSDDGRRIAYAVERPEGREPTMVLRTIDVVSGEKHSVASPKWLYVQHVAWARDTGLAVSAREISSSYIELWYVPLRSGKPARLGSDVESYYGTSVARDTPDLVSVQVQTLSNIYTVAPGQSGGANQLTPGTGRYFDLAWMPNGQLLYASDATGAADIWLMNADGTEAHQITAGAGLNWGPVSDPDGKYIAFHSNRSGSWQVWRADSDGSHAVQMTNGEMGSNFPHFTQDGREILFQRTDRNGRTSIWKISEEGGEPKRLTSALTSHPVQSPKDGRIAAWYSRQEQKQDWKLALFPAEGGDPIRVFESEFPVTPESQIAWTPTGDAIAFLAEEGGVFNLWLQPVNGESPKQFTSYRSGQIYSFDWSKKGLLAYSHGLTTSDVVIAHEREQQE